MSEKNIKSVEEYMRRVYRRTTRHFLEDDMDFDESMNTAIEETSDEVILDLEKEFMAQMLKMIFRK